MSAVSTSFPAAPAMRRKPKSSPAHLERPRRERQAPSSGFVRAWGRTDLRAAARGTLFAGIMLGYHRAAAAPANWLLDEGDTVDTGDRLFKIRHLPGHSPGSIALLDEEEMASSSPGDAHLRRRTGGRHSWRSRICRPISGRCAGLPELDIRIGRGGHGPKLRRARHA